jgi:hypothetical protein
MVQEISKRPGVTEDNDTIPLPSLQLPALPSPQHGEGSEYVASAHTTRHPHLDQSAHGEEQMNQGEIVPSQHHSHESKAQSSGHRRNQVRQEAMLRTPAVTQPIRKRQNVRTEAKRSEDACRVGVHDPFNEELTVGDRQRGSSTPLADLASGMSAELSQPTTHVKLDHRTHQLAVEHQRIGQPTKPDDMEWAA